MGSSGLVDESPKYLSSMRQTLFIIMIRMRINVSDNRGAGNLSNAGFHLLGRRRQIRIEAIGAGRTHTPQRQRPGRGANARNRAEIFGQGWYAKQLDT
jgi:hypothetical protein